MDALLLYGGTLGLTLLGLPLFHLADQFLRQAERPATPPMKTPARNTCFAVMAAFNIGMAAIVPHFYGTPNVDVLRTVLLCCILWPCAWVDAQTFLIPNRVLLAGSVFCAALLAVGSLLEPARARYYWLGAGLGALILLLAALFCRLLSPKAVGMGDIKLLAVTGLCLGTELMWSALFFAFAVLFFYSVFLLATKRAKRTDSIPFAPFLLVGTLAGAFLAGI